MAKRQKYTLDDGREMVFSTKKLNKCFKMYENKSKKQDAKISKENIRQEIADKCCVSESAIKHWMLGHNAPGDYDKVKDLANALGVSAEDLLEIENESSEEKINMENIITENKIDYSTTKSVVRDLYTEMVGYIEMYRTVRDYSYKADSSVLKLMFRNLYIALMKAKLDLPKNIFSELYYFTVNYLQQMGCYAAFVEDEETNDLDYEYIEEYFGIDRDLDFDEKRFAYYCPDSAWEADAKPWSKNVYVDIIKLGKYFEDFKEAAIEDSNVDGEFNIAEIEISGKAYQILNTIFKDYIPA